MVRFGTAIVLVPLLIDGIGTDRAGLFFFATTLTGYFTAVELGIGTSVTKYVAELRAHRDVTALNSLLRASFLTMLGLGVLVALALTVLAIVAPTLLFDQPSVRDEATPTLLVAAVASFFYWVSRLGFAALNGLERYDASAVIGIGVSLLTLGGIAALIQVTSSVPVLVGFFGLATTLEGIVSGILAWPHLELRRRVGRWWGVHLRPVIGLGSALFVIGIADTLVYSLDRTIAAAFGGAAAVVIYEIAARPHNGIRAVSSLAGSALISTSSRLLAQDRHDRVKALVITGGFIDVVSTLPVAVLFMVLAEPLITLWVGDQFARYAVYAQIFASYWLVHSTTGVLGSVVTGLGQMRVFVVLAVIGGVVTLGLSIWLASLWGVVGVIWGTVIPAWLGLPIWLYFALRKLAIPIRDYVEQVIVPGYGFTAAWAIPVIAGYRALQPESLLQVTAFALVAAAAYAGLVLPSVRRRWRHALQPA